MIDVVRTDAIAHQAVHQFFHHVHLVVDALQQYALVAHHHAAFSDSGQCGSGIFAKFVDVVEVCIEPEAFVLLEYVKQAVCKALRQHHRRAGTQADDVHVLDLHQLAQYLVQPLIAQGERITATEDDVTYFLVFADVFDGSVHVFFGHGRIVFTGFSAARAMAAIHGALVGKQQQHTIRIAMRHSRHGCIFVFAERVCHIHVCDVAFLNPGDGLFADRVVGVVGVYQ